MVNKENIQKWVKALRSGKYKQAYCALKVSEDDSSFSHCCLGVACEVYLQETGDGVWNSSTSMDDGYAYKFKPSSCNPSSSFLPIAVRNWFGINDLALATVNDHKVHATTLNDGDNTSSIDKHNFDQIADAIERTYLK